MRMMSFRLTTDQVRARTKTVTRRRGWRTLRPGTLIQPVIQCQGLPKGARVERIGGPIRVTHVRQERLDLITPWDVRREGFPDLSPAQFVGLFCEANRCTPDTVVTRIAFEYVDAPAPIAPPSDSSPANGLAFEIRCVPPTVTAQTKRVRWTPQGPRFFQSARLQRAAAAWVQLLSPFRPPAPLDGALELQLTFVYPHPQKTRKADRGRRLPKITTPDAGNVAKHFEDLLVRMRFLEDDARVARLVIEKYTGPPDQVGIAVRLSPFAGEPA